MEKTTAMLFIHLTKQETDGMKHEKAVYVSI